MTGTMLIDIAVVLLSLGIGYWLGWTAPKDDNEYRPFD